MAYRQMPAEWPRAHYTTFLRGYLLAEGRDVGRRGQRMTGRRVGTLRGVNAVTVLS